LRGRLFEGERLVCAQSGTSLPILLNSSNHCNAAITISLHLKKLFKRMENNMDRLSIYLKNCYGITELKEEFEFEKSNAVLVYAPNGVMKTSLANTFLRISKGLSPEEKVYGLVPEFDITFNNIPVAPDQILVISPFDPKFESKNVSTLLVNTEKKEIYDSAFSKILKAKKKLISKLNKKSRIKQEEIERKMSSDIGENNIFDCIKVLSSFDNYKSDFADVEYATIYDEKVLELLKEENIASSIHEYSNRYNKIVAKSNLLKLGKFNIVNADQVSRTLKKENFFFADHKLLLKGHNEPVVDSSNFEKIIEDEKNSIFDNSDLRIIAEKIIGGVSPVKSFQQVLEKFPHLAIELLDAEAFKKVLWGAYYASEKNEFDELLSIFESKKDELIEIEKQAKLEDTLWYEVKETFKSRFYVPFSIDIENHKNAILGTTAPNLTFTFPGQNPTNAGIKFNRGQLESLDFLSVGESRAMYLMYVIFEIKARLNGGKKTIVVFDDVADSFDYKNKYAIIEFLKDLSSENNLKLIVLTHNFDFYRTFQSRVLDSAKWENSYVANRENGCINLLKGGNKDVASPFDHWKQNCHINPSMLISMIPFVRNLIEYKDGAKSPEYMKLTSMLHVKIDTKNILISDLEAIISSVVKCHPLDPSISKTDKVIDFIYKTSEIIAGAINNNEICLENKVTLSIAIRLRAEQYMWNEVSDKTEISGSQTGKLFDRLSKEKGGVNLAFAATKKTLNQVIVMTPENIHLNSFMYEPLIDMSNHHLVTLYQEVKKL
jgi:hypothetical protein